MRVIRYFNNTAFVVIKIGLIVFLLASGIGPLSVNGADEGKVNYTRHFIYFSVNKVNPASFSDESQSSYLRGEEGAEEWRPRLLCRFLFQCPIGCQCNLAAEIITINCPRGLSVFQVEYPTSLSESDSYSQTWFSHHSSFEDSTDHSTTSSLSWSSASFSDLPSSASFSDLSYPISSSMKDLPSSGSSPSETVALLSSLVSYNLSSTFLKNLDSKSTLSSMFEKYSDLPSLASFDLFSAFDDTKNFSSKRTPSANFVGNYGGSTVNHFTIYSWFNASFNSISRGAFKHLENIEDCYLILSLSNIEDIPARQFEGLSQLHGLFIDNNKIASLHHNAFTGLDSLVYLYLRFNRITGILPNQFQKLTNLKVLYLNYNEIRVIGPQSFTSLPKLDILQISHNNITEIHLRGFQGLINLVRLMLSYNFISQVQPKQFQAVSKLKSLHLDHNHIAEMHINGFQGLANLLKLNLNYNNITEIQPQMFQGVPKLEFLYLKHNSITKIYINESLVLKNLLALNLNNNNITRIQPHLFQGGSKLYILHLEYNSIAEMPLRIFQGLVDLWGVYLNNNNITKVQPQQFQGAPNLFMLHLECNSIAEMHVDGFQGLVTLQEVYLNNNNITIIQQHQFQGAPRLRTIHLEHNNIAEMHVNGFLGLADKLYKYLSYNNITEIQPQQFFTYYLDLNHNRITKIPSKVFPEYSKLFLLYLDHNSIVWIHLQAFQTATNLRILSLSNNMISEVPIVSIKHHENTESELNLHHNIISKIHMLQFQNLTTLLYLTLNNNNISDIHPDGFQGLSDLLRLDLQNNRISSMQSKHFESFHKLQFLDLSNNIINELAFPSSAVLGKLKFLLLSDNKLRMISNDMFKNMSSLTYLDVSNNYINIINSMSSVSSLIGPISEIDLRKNNLYSLNTASFRGFRNSTRVMVDNEATCCFIKTANCSASIPRSQFLTCGRLLPNLIQRVSMWILGIFTLFSNIGVLFYRYRYKQKENKVQKLLISNLSISDTIMGIYMIIIVSADLYYKKVFPSEWWRLSFTCKFAGTLSVLSSEASVFFVTLISVDRFIGIKFAFSTYRIDTNTSRILSLLIWVTAILISIVLTVISSINPNFYDVSEVCTGLPLSRRNIYESRIEQYNFTFYVNIESKEQAVVINKTYDVITGHQAGMYLGMAIFTALNSVCFIVVCACYIGIFVATIKTAKKAGRSLDLKQERKMAIKMGTVVLTDLACWVPVILLSILVQSGGYIVTPHVYTWIVTFVLPINSAINPFLYTLASLIFDFVDKCKNPDNLKM